MTLKFIFIKGLTDASIFQPLIGCFIHITGLPSNEILKSIGNYILPFCELIFFVFSFTCVSLREHLGFFIAIANKSICPKTFHTIKLRLFRINLFFYSHLLFLWIDIGFFIFILWFQAIAITLRLTIIFVNQIDVPAEFLLRMSPCNIEDKSNTLTKFNFKIILILNTLLSDV